jgi:hypothetical protein
MFADGEGGRRFVRRSGEMGGWRRGVVMANGDVSNEVRSEIVRLDRKAGQEQAASEEDGEGRWRIRWTERVWRVDARRMKEGGEQSWQREQRWKGGSRSWTRVIALVDVGGRVRRSSEVFTS